MKVGIYVRVSTADQRDNGYSIDSQIRMLHENCEKKGYSIVATYNDAGFSGKNLQRPNMQRAIEDISNHRIDILMAIKVDRLTRANYDGFWLLKYCEANDVKIELILESFDLNTLSGEMMYGMNVMFGNHERRQIGARTKRALEQMAISKIHPSKAPFGYTRNKDTGRLEINTLEAEIVKEIFNMCRDRMSINMIGKILKEKNYYISKGSWRASKVANILHNTIYTGKFNYRSSNKKAKDIITIDDYCEPIIDNETWNVTRINITKNKHSNYGSHIHLFSGMIACPECEKILSSSNSMKNTGKSNAKTYYHLVCENDNCKLKNKHYNTERIEEELASVLDELTKYMLNMDKEIIVSTNVKASEINDLDKAIDKLKMQEKKLVDLYMNSSLDIDIINKKSDMIKSEIERITMKKQELDPSCGYKNYDVELYSKLNCNTKNKEVLINKDLLTFSFNDLSRKEKQNLIQTMISTFDVHKDERHNIKVTNIKFSDEFVNKNSEEYIDYVSSLMFKSSGIIYTSDITSEDELDSIKQDNYVYSLNEINSNYDKKQFDELLNKIHLDFKDITIENKRLVLNEVVKDRLLVVLKDSSSKSLNDYIDNVSKKVANN